MRETELRAWLRQKASYLSSGLPVDVERILRDQSIELRRLDQGSTSLRDGEARELRDHRYAIAYVHHRDQRTRFTLAHELAHVLLARDLSCKPADNSSYWAHERLCDDFAEHLLIRDEVVTSFQRSSLVNWMMAVADAAGTSMEPAARRVVEFRTDASILKLALSMNKMRDRVAKIAWLVGRPVDGLARGKYLYKTDQVGELAHRILDAEEWAPLARVVWPEAKVEAHVRARTRTALVAAIWS
jgi:hypothetical protein